MWKCTTESLFSQIVWLKNKVLSWREYKCETIQECFQIVDKNWTKKDISNYSGLSNKCSLSNKLFIVKILRN